MQAIKITVNGLDLKIPSGTTVEGLLDTMEEPVRHDMIVEVNGRFTLPGLRGVSSLFNWKNWKHRFPVVANSAIRLRLQ